MLKCHPMPTVQQLRLRHSRPFNFEWGEKSHKITARNHRTSSSSGETQSAEQIESPGSTAPWALGFSGATWGTER